MGLLRCSEMRQLEEAAFANGVSAEALMNKAGRRIGEALVRLVPGTGCAVAYIGRGNNGGDALVALRVLKAAGWDVVVRSPYGPLDLGALPSRKVRELGNPPLQDLPFDSTGRHRPLLLLDGLLGIGASGSPREPLNALAAEMNALRLQGGALVAAIDIPSGVDGDSGVPHPGAVMADFTLTVGVPKPGLVADAAINHVGRLELIPLEELPVPAGGDRLIVPGDLCGLFPPRPFDMHKGDAGRVGVVAGSRGYLGAAMLTSLGALRGGAGLVTLFVRENLYPLAVSNSPPPEVMIRPVESYREVREYPLDALAMGPGLGRPKKKRRAELQALLDAFAGPVVLDADGLNLVAEAGTVDGLGRNVVVTPHPGELERLAPGSSGMQRAEAARNFTRTRQPVLLFKGSRTIVTAPGEPLHYNPTGTPGMATGGQGDVLTGLLAALLAQGLTPLDAARAGAWIAGRASELALASGWHSVQSLTATATTGWIGPTFRELQGRP